MTDDPKTIAFDDATGEVVDRADAGEATRGLIVKGEHRDAVGYRAHAPGDIAAVGDRSTAL